MKYKSTQVSTIEESGNTEIKLTHKKGLFRKIFGLNEKVETYIGTNTTWFNKSTGVRAGTVKESELTSIVLYHNSILQESNK